MILESKEKHCDDYIRDKSQPKCLRAFLLFHRVPAMDKYKWEERGWKIPTLFATYEPKHGPGGGKGKVKRVRVTMASRFGDVGISTDLKGDGGYDLRVNVSDLRDFSESESFK